MGVDGMRKGDAVYIITSEGKAKFVGALDSFNTERHYNGYDDITIGLYDDVSDTEVDRRLNEALEGYYTVPNSWDPDMFLQEVTVSEHRYRDQSLVGLTGIIIGYAEVVASYSVWFPDASFTNKVKLIDGDELNLVGKKATINV